MPRRRRRGVGSQGVGFLQCRVGHPCCCLWAMESWELCTQDGVLCEGRGGIKLSMICPGACRSYRIGKRFLLQAIPKINGSGGWG